MQFESVRQRKLADQIKKYISDIIERKLKDPHKGFITITHAKISGDLKIASLYFTVLGDEIKRRESVEALDRAKNFIRRELAHLLKIRYVPEIRFFYDDSLDYSEHIEELLKKIQKTQTKEE